MNPYLMAGALIFAASSALAADVAVSITMGHPGYYGRVDVGSLPRPPLIYAEPVIIAPAPVRVVQPPLYLRVPPGQARDWSKHCRKYGACAKPVYFVEDRWYTQTYVPEYSKRHGKKHHKKHHSHD